VEQIKRFLRLYWQNAAFLHQEICRSDMEYQVAGQFSLAHQPPRTPAKQNVAQKGHFFGAASVQPAGILDGCLTSFRSIKSVHWGAVISMVRRMCKGRSETKATEGFGGRMTTELIRLVCVVGGLSDKRVGNRANQTENP